MNCFQANTYINSVAINDVEVQKDESDKLEVEEGEIPGDIFTISIITATDDGPFHRY